MRRTTLALALASTVPLAACAAGGEAADAEASDKTLRITWWGNPARAEATQAAIELFEERHPDIQVKASPASFDGYYDKLTTEFASGAAPDVFQDDQVATWASKGLLLDLDDYADTLDTSAIDESFLNQGTVDGTLYEVPAGSSPMALVYQPQTFEDAGLEPPAADTTWEEFADLAAELQRALPEDMWALGDSSSKNNHFQVFLRQQGQDWFAEDQAALGFEQDALVQWWEYWAELRDQGVVPPADVTAGSAGGQVTEDPVATEKVAMSIYGTSITLPSSEWSYGSLPNESPDPGVYLMRANSWAVNADTEHPDEAVALVDFLLNDKEAGEILGVTRGIPANADIAEGIRDGLDEQQRQIADYVDYLRDGNSRPAPSPDPAGTRDIRSEMFDRYSQQVMFGQKSAAEAAEGFMAEATQLIEAGQ